MTAKNKVKVIKKEDIKPVVKAVKADKNKSKRAVAREMVSTVSNWVSDFQTRKRDETKMALEQLLVKNPQTAGSQ